LDRTRPRSRGLFLYSLSAKGGPRTDISRVLYPLARAVTICLRRRSPDACSDRYPRARRAARIALLFGLAPGGVCLAGRSPGRRWALTPPFHPCLSRSSGDDPRLSAV